MSRDSKPLSRASVQKMKTIIHQDDKILQEKSINHETVFDDQNHPIFGCVRKNKTRIIAFFGSAELVD